MFTPWVCSCVSIGAIGTALCMAYKFTFFTPLGAGRLSLCQCSLFYVCSTRKKTSPVCRHVRSSFFLPFIVGWCRWPTTDTCLHQAGYVYAQPPAYHKDMVGVVPLELAQRINEQLCRALRHYPHATCIFFPESTFPFALDELYEARQMWADNALFGARQVTVVIGSHRAYGRDRNNTLYCLKGCRIISSYDKSTCLPFAEYMPWPWNKSSFFSEFLLKNKKIFQSADGVSSSPIVMRLPNQIVASPYICSDLFFNYPRPHDQATTIVWLVNDSWFCTYYRHLMGLFARLQAHVYKRTIVYIAHEYGICIEPHAPCQTLASVMIPKNIN